jgi:uncharacterized membrane protein
MKGLLPKPTPRRQFWLALLFASAVCLGLYGYGLHRAPSLDFSYLPWNLLLSALPLVFALQLVRVLRHKRWSDWEPIGWSLLWLLFLPNSFYMISDYIHLRNVPSAEILYAAVMFTAFIYLGIFLGYCSLALVHHELRRRMEPRLAAGWMALTLLICSFAIYIGRDLRWNSWDVIFSPAGLLFDISDRFLRPSDYPTMFVTVLSFFVLLSSLYAVVWAAAKLLRRVDPNVASAYPQFKKTRR